MLVRYQGIYNEGVLERPWTIWKVLKAISSTLKCQFTGKCWKVDFPITCKTKSCQSSTECLRMVRALPPDTPRPPQFQPELQFFHFLQYFRFFQFFLGSLTSAKAWMLFMLLDEDNSHPRLRSLLKRTISHCSKKLVFALNLGKTLFVLKKTKHWLWKCLLTWFWSFNLFFLLYRAIVLWLFLCVVCVSHCVLLRWWFQTFCLSLLSDC